MPLEPGIMSCLVFFYFLVFTSLHNTEYKSNDDDDDDDDDEDFSIIYAVFL